MSTATQRNPYEVLGVERDATAEDIKRAYRKQAVRFHPDRNPGDTEAEESFKQASEAYSILGDADKRSRYDRFGHAGVGGAGASVNEEIFRDFEDLFAGGSVFDLFGQMFGGAPSGRGPRRGHDIQYELHLDFAEPRRDLSKRLRISRAEACDECRGSGIEPGRSARSCPRCGGRGQEQMRRGFVVMSQPCGACRGAGTIVDHPCRECRGAGQLPQQRDVTVRLPAGVDDGNQLRIAGEGEAGVRGGPPGDLFVLVRLRPDSKLRREGTTVRSTSTISFPEAALGTRLSVATIWGQESLRVPPGTQPGTELRLPNRGFPVLRGGARGDHLVRVLVEVPKKLDPPVRQAIESLAARLEGRPEDGPSSDGPSSTPADSEPDREPARGRRKKDRDGGRRRSRFASLFS